MNDGERRKTDKELKRYLADMNRFAKEAAASEKKALRFERELGCAAVGELPPPVKPLMPVSGEWIVEIIRDARDGKRGAASPL